MQREDGAGCALHRAGYARGIAAAAAAVDTDQLPRLYGWRIPGLDRDRLAYVPHGGMMFYGSPMLFGTSGLGGWIVPLLPIAGVMTLIVAGVHLLTRRPPVESHANPAPASQAAIESAAAKPA